ncbi:MAG: lysozyme inhibitor LprI family protein [Caulobacterales bacterium]|jgi:uncharacterized protein YecT (DUF1311 family)
MTSRIAIGAAAAVMFVQVTGAAFAAEDDPWTEANGRIEASRIIVSCLASMSSSEPQHAKARCIDEPIAVCADRHAGNEVTLGECTGFAREAWRERLRQQIARMRAAAGPLARDFDDSQDRWRAWTERECIFQAAPAEGGSLRGELWNTCDFTHSAQRALELEALANEWEAHPPSRR